MKESEVHNQFQQVLWYLYSWDRPFSLAEVIKHSMFYKFGSRMSEIDCKEMNLIGTRTKVNFTNRFGRSSYYYYYEAIDREQIKTLFYKYGGL